MLFEEFSRLFKFRGYQRTSESQTSQIDGTNCKKNHWVMYRPWLAEANLQLLIPRNPHMVPEETPGSDPRWDGCFLGTKRRRGVLDIVDRDLGGYASVDKSCSFPQQVSEKPRPKGLSNWIHCWLFIWKKHGKEKPPSLKTCSGQRCYAPSSPLQPSGQANVRFWLRFLQTCLLQQVAPMAVAKKQ